ncbi:MAG: sarcosine oxidase subunit beta family protein [Alphaproteobacteria bacterium]|nr:sarcosine oxidase subunit beta family protein [Alphaproteobacteria bacterium]MDA8010312.1 sarcosine oxidase subunit beta family protein [Alphaproteobacteria bacterium]
MQRYSAFSLVRHALSEHKHWQRAWRSPAPKPRYDAIIVGGGGHGLGTAYYLARHHNLKNIAVLERGWIGGGNTGRNTTIIRSNYLQEESQGLYELARKMWETLSQELNYNVMFSPRGVLNLCHDEHELKGLRRRVFANQARGVRGEFLTPREVKQFCPPMRVDCPRLPVVGASLQRNAGTARHDAVAWGYARAADRLGVDIIENCTVNGFDIRDGAVRGVRTTRGDIAAPKVALVPAGHAGVLANLAGFRLPIESRPLQALVSEPVKPCLDTVVMSGAIHGYVSQSDKGELVIGGGADSYNGYSQRGSPHVLAGSIAAVCHLFPQFRRLRMLRSWGGVVDIAPDASAILSAAPVGGIYVNCGWGTGGFKATPGSAFAFAHLVAKGEPHLKGRAFTLARFATGRLIDEHSAAAVAH